MKSIYPSDRLITWSGLTGDDPKVNKQKIGSLLAELVYLVKKLWSRNGHAFGTCLLQAEASVPGYNWFAESTL
jgi:hypothetical protein